MLAIQGAYGPRIHAAGDTRPRRDDERIPLGWLPFWRIAAIIDGTLSVRGTGKRQRFEPGSVFIQHPGRRYDLKLSQAAHWAWVTFDAVAISLEPLPPRLDRSSARLPKHTRTVQPSAEATWGGAWPERLPAALCEATIVDLRRIAGIFFRGDSAYLEANAVLTSCLAHLAGAFLNDSGQVQSRMADSCDPRLTEAERFAIDRLPAATTVAEMAASIGWSREHFTRIYTRHMQRRPAKFLTHIRVREAQRLLRQEDDSITAIAGLMRFATPANFSTWFKRQVGCTPQAWRQG